MRIPLDRSPMQEIAKRTAEAGAGLVAGGRAAGLQDYVANLADNRKRTRDGHGADMKSLGMDDASAGSGGDDVGNIWVTGDVYGDEAVRLIRGEPKGESIPTLAPISESKPEPKLEPAAVAKGLLSRFAPLVITAAISGPVGAGLLMLLLSVKDSLDHPPQPEKTFVSGPEYILDLPEAIE